MGIIKVRRMKATEKESIVARNHGDVQDTDLMGFKIWDNRSHGLIHDYHEHTDFIADMTFSANKNTLIAVA